MSEDIVYIKVVDREGVAHQLKAPTDMGLNVMELCKAEGLPVEGTCGGMALCASCQCYVLSSHNLLERSDAEEDMLDQAFYVKQNSRLGCQIQISNELDKLEIELAPEA